MGVLPFLYFFLLPRGSMCMPPGPRVPPAPEVIGLVDRSTRSQVRELWFEILIWMPPTYMTLAKQKSPALASTY